MLISKDGGIWVSYFDEGIYGNKGWGSLSPDNQYVRPIGSSGLVRFDRLGQKTWEFSAPAGFRGIDDCYALNVSDDTTWAYYYAEFALACVDSHSNVRAWRTEVSGARAFAVHDNRVLLYGGYEPDESRLILGNLAESTIENPREISLSPHLDQRRLKQGVTAVGRGPIINLFADRQWYQLDLRTLP